ncbi:hypothetical protein LTR10_024504 [Elasticomyces elasticus]|uniref:Uncharacterized protein n=7 Tax=Naganishia TaxID=1851509 RepID=A0ACC2V059_9TREE|nr:hypothetical protein QFC21_006804 [Naganishia friedmannii]KAJ9092724.1 hypothetical protein QFC19_008649 [Naganishia cerealis]KAK4933869.1 hypothetical protein LTR10_024504 [Elasticomyces elasticus]KAJ9092776.1 hypothetical protein QFC21_006650 [Naganishia friedmannii]KAJ9093900.1 hypothetical protein QFC21_006273 [Naganishia friedmannii]
MAHNVEGIHHTCFVTALPQLPIGYQFDPVSPMQLVPFTHFSKLLEPIAICRECYNRAITSWDVLKLNRISAERTAKSSIASTLSGFSQFAASINSCRHPMFDDLHPPAIREARTVHSVLGHEARAGSAKRKPRMTYIIIYSIGNSPRLSPPTRLSEVRLRAYYHALREINNYWYGAKPHHVNTPFIRSVLTRLTPFVNSALWNKLPWDESLSLHYLHNKRKLHEWKSGMTYAQYKAVEDSA